MATDQGDARAQSNLGGMYYNGEGVPQDHVEASKWFKLTADQGDADAITALPILLHQHLFPPGTKVKLVGFNSAALNGKRGVVVEGNAALGRVVVLVDGDAKLKAFSFENLVVVAEVACESGGVGGAAASAPSAPPLAALGSGGGTVASPSSSPPAAAYIGGGGAATAGPGPADVAAAAAADEKRRKKKGKAARQKAKKQAAAAEGGSTGDGERGGAGGGGSGGGSGGGGV